MARKSKSNLAVAQNDNMVEQIIAEANAGIDRKQIANKFKVDIGTVYRICKRAQNKQNINDLAVVDPEEVKQELNEESVEDIAKQVIEEVKEEKPKKTRRKTAKKPEEPKEEQPKEEPKKKHNRLTPELKHNIIRDYFSDSDKMTQTDLALLYEVSPTSVRNIIKNYNEFLGESVKSSSNALSSQLMAIPIDGSKTITNSNEYDISKLKDLDNSGYVSLGLIQGRHDMGVEDYIFENIDNELMFNFDAQYVIARNYINGCIPFKNGKAAKGIMLYTSGLQSVLSTVIRVCTDMKIPLTIMHYNAETHQYVPQTILEDTTITNSVPLQFNNILNRYARVSLYDCTPQDVIDYSGKIVEVVDCYYDSPMGSDKRNILRTEIILFINIEAAWDCFRKKANEFIEDKSIFINYGQIINNKYMKDANIARASN